MADNFITNVSELSSSTKKVIESNAKSQGMTPEEYLQSRGGVNPVTGKYGDSYDPTRDLTDAEYLEAIAGKTGTARGAAINEATAKKRGISLYEYTGGQYDANGNFVGSSTNAVGLKTDAQIAAELKAGENKAARQSAYDLLYAEFNKYGLGSLVKDIEYLIKEDVPASEFAIKLQQTPAYQQRFSANKDRIAAGLRALSPAEYIGLEDQYQNIMRNYGLPASYYTKDATGKQAGFDKFLAGDVSAAELEDRIATAQKRVINADVNVSNALKQFYPDITNGDILAYTLDPKNALENIKRKVTAAEIGGAAMAQGLNRGTTPEEIAAYAARANELARYGVTGAQAQQGYGAIAEFLPTAEKLGDIYAKQGMGAYDQATAEQEVFGTAGAATAATKRKKLTELERAAFAGSTGAAQGALARERAGQF